MRSRLSVGSPVAPLEAGFGVGAGTRGGYHRSGAFPARAGTAPGRAHGSATLGRVAGSSPAEPRDEAELPGHLVLFDGVCRFCDRAVDRLLAADPRGVLHFAPLQGETAAALRRRHPEIPEQLDTIVYVERRPGEGAAGERVYLRSEAAIRIAERIEGPWRRLAWLRLLPRPVTDLGYRLFVRVRYRIFGQRAECRVPAPEERDRFLP